MPAKMRLTTCFPLARALNTATSAMDKSPVPKAAAMVTAPPAPRRMVRAAPKAAPLLAPNMSGVPLVDQARGMYLAELGLEFCRQHLKPDGAFLVKVFQGSDYENFLRAMREVFKTVAVRKPDASRDRSAELYLLGRVLR